VSSLEEVAGVPEVIDRGHGIIVESEPFILAKTIKFLSEDSEKLFKIKIVNI